MNRPLLDVNRDQAMVPETAAIIRNAHGTAPGYHFSEHGKHFFVTPGVPFEMKAMAERVILPVLRASVTEHRAVVNLRSSGIGESVLADRLSGIEMFFDRASLAYLPSPLGVTLRITVVDRNRSAAEQLRDAMKAFVLERAGDFIYGEGSTSLEEVTGKLLHGRGASLAVAESCTGGLLASRITDIPGSSSYFERGLVTYSNACKTELLGIDPGLIAAVGAVSRDVAIAMAMAVRARSGSSYGLSTTGIAGPGGGSEAKPVGLVWIGLSAENFGSDRGRTKARAVQAALELLRRRLIGLPLPPSSQS